MASSKSNTQNLHFIMFPLMAPGHMIPVIDMSILIAKHGITVSIITTPINVSRLQPTINRAIEVYSLDIRLVQLAFPPTEDGIIPEGCENIDMLPSLNLAYDFIRVVNKLQEPVEKFLKEVNPRPSCIISDMGFAWTNELAKKFNIPRIVFHGFCCFSLLCLHNLEKKDFLASISSETEPFVIPDLPDKIVTTKAKLPNSVKLNSSELYNWRQFNKQAEKESFGIVVNSFKELELEYFNRYKEAKGKSVWCLGPVSLCTRDNLDRGNKAAITREQCLKWLDLRNPNSVIYVCLGSLCNLAALQMMELALGLEATKRPFILTFRGGYDLNEVENLIKEDGFEERVKGKGLIIRGWAPQVLILSHSSVGGFLTHCGWNSTLEGLTAAVPMVTCPMFAEQFLNEEYVVGVLKVGTRVRNEISEVKRDGVRKAVELVMSDEGEGKEMRARALKFRVMARKAVEEKGSSDMDLRSMIQEVVHYIEKQKQQQKS
ncbi:hypothetical protein RND81_04G065100 [Saponaria officinalis]|uniref:Glycosyltransferase n=1 Tax=Saponaria officinalis TaxID=3572 RepID=A0AAW1LJD3_SAPOF